MTADPQGKVTDARLDELIDLFATTQMVSSEYSDDCESVMRELQRLRQPAATGAYGDTAGTFADTRGTYTKPAATGAAVCETCGGRGGSGYATTGHLAWDRCPKCLGMPAVPERAGGEVAEVVSALRELQSELRADPFVERWPKATNWISRAIVALSAPAAVAKGEEKPAAGEQIGLSDALNAVAHEVTTAIDRWPPFSSAHEGYGVLLEEVDELWDEVKINQKKRDLATMQKEAIQVAAMAVRFAIEVCNEERGRK